MPYAEVTGLDMYHDVQGDGEPLVLVHAGMASVPDRWIPFFAPYLRVIAPEQMGGVVPPTSASGYSDGGIVGLDIAIHHPTPSRCSARPVMPGCASCRMPSTGFSRAARR